MKAGKEYEIWCRDCQAMTRQIFIKDLTGSGPGYYQSTQGMGCRATVYKCKKCNKKQHYTEDT